MNCITLAVMLMAQAYFWKREVWMINHLSEDNTVPYSNLPSEVNEYPEFEDAVAGYNRGAFYFALAVGCCIAINFGMSSKFLIKGDGVYNYNLGSRTITGLLTVRFAAHRASHSCEQRLTCLACLPAEHYAREHQGAGLLIIRAIKLLKCMVRRMALRRWRGAALTPASQGNLNVFGRTGVVQRGGRDVQGAQAQGSRPDRCERRLSAEVAGKGGEAAWSGLEH